MTPREPSPGPVEEGTLLWEPTEGDRARANVTRYMDWLKAAKGLSFASYADLWRWSVTDLETFWATILEFFQVIGRQRGSPVLADPRIMGARWCPGMELNYAEHALRRRDAHPAVIFRSEGRSLGILTFGDLSRQTAVVASALREMGVRRGDRVAAYMPNIPETLIAFLATASLGAIWSSCPPEFGTRSVLDRFRQIEPRALFAVDGYRYNGQVYDRLAAVAEIQANLPDLEATVIVPHLAAAPPAGGPGVRMWPALFSKTVEPSLAFERVPFNHPLWILYSSGTTGLPKAIVQGHGGILLEHLKAISLHLDLGPGDRFFWYTTTGWMMWNFLISGLLLGTTIILYDGSPSYPSLRVLWQLAEEAEMTYFGTSAPFLAACGKAGCAPGKEHDLGRLRGLGSTGAPLAPEGFGWVYDHVKEEMLLGSVSGGTDLCTAFVLSCPLLPVRAGEIQCRGLGAKVEAFDATGRPVMDEVGELVITEPLPSMPVSFWNDPDGRRYRESYFETFPGVWRHGDWVKITSRGSCVIYGRSDATINRAGVRMGTSEFYRVVEDVPEVLDSLAVDTGQLGSEGQLLLFVVLREGQTLDEQLKARIKSRMRTDLSPRHVPDEIYAIPEIPRTLNGKKVEVPVKRILAGTPAAQAVSADAMSNPDALRFFVDLVGRRPTRG
jgi:acetoacetyl-CoA synthetase